MLLKTLHRRWKLNQHKENLAEIKAQFRQVTFCIKTFERPEALAKLLRSMDYYYGYLGDAISIIIVDDSENPQPPKFSLPFSVKFIPLPFDQGTSTGRNVLLDQTTTPYFIYLDDDYVFNKDTNIESFLELVKEYPEIDILAGEVYNKGNKKVLSCCTINLQNEILTRQKKPYKILNNIKFYDFVVNFYIAKTEKIKLVRWDDDLKTVEHTAFFLRVKQAGLICAESPTVKIDHNRPKNKHYKKFRKGRVDEYVAIFKSKYKIKEVIEQ